MKPISANICENLTRINSFLVRAKAICCCTFASVHKILLFTFFLFAITGISGQIFRGHVLIEDRTSLYLNQVFVTNVTAQKTVLADGSGLFAIPAKPGDVVRFTSIVTERKDYRMTEQLLTNTDNIISLPVAYFEIEEIVIKNFKPTQNLRNDVLAMKQNTRVEKIKKAIGLPEPKGNGLPPSAPLAAFAGGGLSFSVDAIYDLLSGEKKKKERLQRYEQMASAVDKIKKYYGTPYFTRLGIPENMIDSFLQFIYSSEDLQAPVNRNNYEVVAFPIEKYLPVFKKRLKDTQLAQESLQRTLPASAGPK